MSRSARRLLVVGGGLFGSQAAAYARRRGIEALVFDPGLAGAASPAAAGLFKEEWVGKKLLAHLQQALPILDSLFGIRTISLENDRGQSETFQFVPPSAILEACPVRETVTRVGDGWLEAGGNRHEGDVYVAAGIWSEQFAPDLEVRGKAGTAFAYAGERLGRIRQIAHGRQAIAFVRDPGLTHFSDGTAEERYTQEHEQATLRFAADLGLHDCVRRFHGIRPYTPGGPLFRQLGTYTWLATGGRKLGTILGAAFAQRLVDVEIRGR